MKVRSMLRRGGAWTVALAVMAAGVSVAGAERPTRSKGGAKAVLLQRIPESGIQPQVATDSEGTAHLVFFRGQPKAGDLYYVRRERDATEFSPPLRVNSQPGSAIAIGSIRGAQIAVGKGNRVHIAWNGSDSATPVGPGRGGQPMLYSRLSDAGTEFEPQRNLIHEAYGLDGGGAIAADASGHVYVTWHANPTRSGEAERRVWLTRSDDNGETFANETAVDSNRDGACGCCGMRAHADARGTLYILFRTARGGTNRDMDLLFSEDRGTSFRSAVLGRWSIPTCPMSSECFAESKDSLFAAWETEGQVFVASIDKKTHRVGKPIPAPGSGGGRKHPTVACNARGNVLLAWSEGTAWERGGSLAWQEFTPIGTPTLERGRGDGVPVWSFPAAYAAQDGTYVIAY